MCIGAIEGVVSQGSREPIVITATQGAGSVSQGWAPSAWRPHFGGDHEAGRDALARLKRDDCERLWRVALTADA
jgi:hypothetical protein